MMLASTTPHPRGDGSTSQPSISQRTKNSSDTTIQTKAGTNFRIGATPAPTVHISATPAHIYSPTPCSNASCTTGPEHTRLKRGRNTNLIESNTYTTSRHQSTPSPSQVGGSCSSQRHEITMMRVHLSTEAPLYTDVGEARSWNRQRTHERVDTYKNETATIQGDETRDERHIRQRQAPQKQNHRPEHFTCHTRHGQQRTSNEKQHPGATWCTLLTEWSMSSPYPRHVDPAGRRVPQRLLRQRQYQRCYQLPPWLA